MPAAVWATTIGQNVPGSWTRATKGIALTAKVARPTPSVGGAAQVLGARDADANAGLAAPTAIESRGRHVS